MIICIIIQPWPSYFEGTGGIWWEKFAFADPNHKLIQFSGRGRGGDNLGGRCRDVEFPPWWWNLWQAAYSSGLSAVSWPLLVGWFMLPAKLKSDVQKGDSSRYFSRCWMLLLQKLYQGSYMYILIPQWDLIYSNMITVPLATALLVKGKQTSMAPLYAQLANNCAKTKPRK